MVNRWIVFFQVGAGFVPISVVPGLRIQRAPIERVCGKFLLQPPIACAHSINFPGTVRCFLIRHCRGPGLLGFVIGIGF